MDYPPTASPPWWFWLPNHPEAYRVLGQTAASVSQYATIGSVVAWGKMCNFLRGAPKHRASDTRVEKEGLPPLNRKHQIYMENFIGYVEDIFNRPIASAPDGYTDIIIREHVDDSWFSPLKCTEKTRRCMNLASYNYLGFAGPNTPCLDKVCNSLRTYPISTGSPAAEIGQLPCHTELEQLVARFVGKPAALIMGMGFATNSTILPALVGPGDLILSDKLNHASAVEGARTSRATIRTFRHNDAAHLEQLLLEATTGEKRPNKILVALEGLYSMEGALCNLAEIVNVAKSYGAYVYLDEAHSIGAMGKTGRGVCEELGVDTSMIDVLMGTFSKSFGAVGGYVASDVETIECIRRYSGGCLESCSMPPACCIQIAEALRVISGEDGTNIGEQKLRQLRENSIYFRQGLKDIGFETLGEPTSPVVPVMVYSMLKGMYFARLAFFHKLAVVSVGAPATPYFLIRVRFCMSAAHTRADLDQALTALTDIARRIGVRYRHLPPNPMIPGDMSTVERAITAVQSKVAAEVAQQREVHAETVEQQKSKWASLARHGSPPEHSAHGWAADVDPLAMKVRLSMADFLGLYRDPELAEACIATVRQLGVGSAGPRAFLGTNKVHLDLEKELAEFLGVEEAVLYGFGACVMSSALPALASAKDIVVADEAVGYGSQIGLQLSKAEVRYYKHCDAEDAARVFKELDAEEEAQAAMSRIRWLPFLHTSPKPRRRFLVTEAIAHETGKLAPLKELIEMRKKYRYRLILDESYSFGVLGATGKGATEHFGLSVTDVDAIVVSMEALGSVGGFCAGASATVAYQRYYGSAYCFSATIPPYLATASRHSLKVLQRQPEKLTALRANADYLRENLSAIPGLATCADESSPIIPVTLSPSLGQGDEAVLQAICAEAQAKGLALCVSRRARRSTVPPSLCVYASAALTEADLAWSVAVIKSAAASALRWAEVSVGEKPLKSVPLPDSRNTSPLG